MAQKSIPQSFLNYNRDHAHDDGPSSPIDGGFTPGMWPYIFENRDEFWEFISCIDQAGPTEIWQFGKQHTLHLKYFIGKEEKKIRAAILKEKKMATRGVQLRERYGRRSKLPKLIKLWDDIEFLSELRERWIVDWGTVIHKHPFYDDLCEQITYLKLRTSPS